MGDYFPEIKKQDGNVIYTGDGTVWATYLLRGINTNPYDVNKIDACQSSHERLFTQLSKLDATEFLLLGAKAQTPAQTIMARCCAGIENFTPQNYPELHAQFNALYRKVAITRELAEYQRVYFLAIGFPVASSIIESLLSSVAVTDPHRNVSRRAITDLENRYFRALPREYTPIRATEEHIDWVFDRARLRAISVPDFPDATTTRTVRRGARSFPEVHINKNADTDALLDDFIAKVKDDNPAMTERGSGLPAAALSAACLAGAAAAAFTTYRWISIALTVLAIAAIAAGSVAVKRSTLSGRNTLLHNFKSTRWAQQLSVHNVGTRSPEFPDGYTSYQTQVAVARYPSTASFDINTFTYLVDQEIGVDADFALRFDFSQELVSKTGMRHARQELNAEDAANTQDELDAEDYADRREDQREFRAHVKDEPAPRGMRVAAIFSFAHQNREILADRVSALEQHLTDHDFTPITPVGGQFELWQAMFPGSPCPAVVDDLKGTTTTALFSGFMPIRRTVLGDPVGIPLMINEENALGQIVHWDILHATDKGNASISATGRQNAGKSEFIKSVIGWMHDFRTTYAHIFDQDPDGEYAVFAQSLTHPDIVDVFDPTATVGGGSSLDILKCFDPATAARVFLDLWLPLLGFNRSSEEAAMLAQFVAPDYRQAARIHSTRALIDHLLTVASPAARALNLALSSWARLPYTHTFIDPVINGQTIEYPAFAPRARTVVFRTHKLTVHRPRHGETSAADDSQNFAAMAYTAIAHLTAERFAAITTPCAFIADELKLLKGSKVLEQLVEKPDRMGRKAKNFVVIAHQLADDADEHTAMIERKLVLAQKVRENSADALRSADIPPTERLVTRHVEDTSPLDPETSLPIPGRAGEGWYNDSGNIGRVRTLGHLLAARRHYSDTRSSTRVRVRDLVSAESTNGHPAHAAEVSP